MKRACLWICAALGAALWGCGGADLTCDAAMFNTECINNYQRYICTHGEKAIEECPTGFSCAESAGKGARCVADNSAGETEESEQNAETAKGE